MFPSPPPKLLSTKPRWVTFVIFPPWVSHHFLSRISGFYYIFRPPPFLSVWDRNGVMNGPCKSGTVMMAWVEWDVPNESQTREALGGCSGRIRRYGLVGGNTSLGASLEVLRDSHLSQLVISASYLWLKTWVPSCCVSCPPPATPLCHHGLLALWSLKPEPNPFFWKLPWSW